MFTILIEQLYKIFQVLKYGIKKWNRNFKKNDLKDLQTSQREFLETA